MMTIADRAERTTEVVAKFRKRPFDWKKRATCIHLARAQARAMGYRPPAIPDFRSAIGARRALKSAGHESLETLLDSLFERIAPAEMWVGDLALVPGEGGLDAIAINAGNGTLLMYHEGGEGLCNVKQALPHVIAAWRL
jgi:hypothetical protein